MPTHAIRFEGDWTRAEQNLLSCAIEDAEALHPGPAAAPWLCYCKRCGGLAVYVAHRPGWPRLLHADNVLDLSFQILFLDEPDPARRKA